MTGSIELIFIQCILIMFLLLFLFYLIQFNISLNLEKRLGKYSIDAINDEPVSFFDHLFHLYQKYLKRLSKVLIKISLLRKYSHKYEKYIDYASSKKAIDFVSNKFMVSFLFILINVLANIIEYKLINIYSLLFIGLIGFFVPDLLLSYNNFMKRKKIEKELLNAIIIMNNAFKSGRSTMQAIGIVENELEGPIKDEFRKMRIEIAYGLSLDVVFKRFSERIKMEEVNYITSSLVILNKTGGNIVKVFSSIENSLFSKKKLELELKSLTSSSTAMIKALLVLPFLFSGIIFIINPAYFAPLYKTELGILVLIVIAIFYILYSYFVRLIMKVRM